MSAFPSSPRPRAVSVTSLAQTNMSVAHSLRQIVTDRGGHRWMFTLEYPAGITRAAFAPLWAFIVSQRGRYGSFDFTLPEHAALGSMAGTPVVHGASQAGRTLATRGWTPSATSVLKAGDFIRLEGSYKAHMVTADVDADDGGLAAVQIEPSIQDDIADGAAVSADGIFRCGLTSDQQTVDVSQLKHYGFSLEIIEVLT